MTISRRLVLLCFGAVAATVLVGSLATYGLVRHELRAGVDEQLRGDQLQVFFVAAKRARPGARAVLPPLPGVSGETGRITPAADEKLKQFIARLPAPQFGGATSVVQVRGKNGIAASAVRPPPGARLPVTAATRAVARGDVGSVLGDETVRGVHLRVLTTRTPEGDVLQIARSLTEVDNTLARLRWVLLAVTLGGIALAMGFGVFVARRALRPVRDLSAAAEEVAVTQDLSTRLPADGADELARLGGSFNAMLGALESSREAQRQLVADASHELRTPLASTRANVELLARAPDLPAGEREQIVGDVCGQLAELSVLVGDLVDLARPELGPVDGGAEFEEIRLDLLAADAVESARPHARGHTLVVDAEPCVVSGSSARLHRALRNLLDNAVKHAPPGSVIEVSVRDGEVVVRDHGPGISDEDLPHIFDRFYRATSARGLPGSGLGLAIVRQVAELHGGSVRAERAEGGGARLHLALPVASLTS